MNIKSAHVYLALGKLRDELGDELVKRGVTFEISMVEDDPGSGKMIECLTIKCSKTAPAKQYDEIKSPTSWDFTIEVFAESDNRPPRISYSGTRDLTIKDN